MSGADVEIYLFIYYMVKWFIHTLYRVYKPYNEDKEILASAHL